MLNYDEDTSLRMDRAHGNAPRVATLEAEAFLRRFLLHVLPAPLRAHPPLWLAGQRRAQAAPAHGTRAAGVRGSRPHVPRPSGPSPARRSPAGAAGTATLHCGCSCWRCPVHKGVAKIFLVNALRWAGVAILDMAAGFLEGLSEAPRIFFAPLVGVCTEI